MKYTASAVVRGVQTILKVTAAPALVVDGIVGPRTLSAYNKAADYIRAVLEIYTKERGFQINQLLAPIVQKSVFDVKPGDPGTRSVVIRRSTTRLEKPVNTVPVVKPVVKTGKFLTLSELRQVVRDAKAQTPSKVLSLIPFMTEDEIIRKIMIESNGNPLAVSPSGNHHGLLQIGSAAWQDLRGFDRTYKVPYSGMGKYDPVNNVRAGMTYWAWIVGQLRHRDISARTPAVIYAAHQQGPAGFATLVKSNISLDAIRKKRTNRKNVDNQSAPSLLVVAEAVGQARGIA